jgi:transposase-like protein
MTDTSSTASSGWIARTRRNTATYGSSPLVEAGRASSPLTTNPTVCHAGRRTGSRPPSCPYLFVDAYYEQVREDGQVRHLAVLVAVGVDLGRKRKILGVSVSLSEHEVHWRTFLESLKTRGLNGVQLITSDDHAGLRAARLAVFGGIPWQRCQFHLQQNAQAYVPRKDMQADVAEDIRTIFNAPNRATADAYWPRRLRSTRRLLPVWPNGWR